MFAKMDSEKRTGPCETRPSFCLNHWMFRSFGQEKKGKPSGGGGGNKSKPKAQRIHFRSDIYLVGKRPERGRKRDRVGLVVGKLHGLHKQPAATPTAFDSCVHCQRGFHFLARAETDLGTAVGSHNSYAHSSLPKSTQDTQNVVTNARHDNRQTCQMGGEYQTDLPWTKHSPRAVRCSSPPPRTSLDFGHHRPRGRPWPHFLRP